MRVNILSVLCGLLLMSAVGMTPTRAASPQAPGGLTIPEQRPPSFPRLFAKPTQNNGYEEWVQAVDLIQNNTDLEALTTPGATLSFKRHLLADPTVAHALALVRAGLNKPIASPRESLDENTLLPELSGFRQLARLLAAEQYVAFAGGHVEEAIDCLRVGLAFGYRIQTDTIISGLVGIAVDSIVLKEFAQHYDQLSLYQCDQALRIVQEFLKAESPAIHLLALEKGYALRMLEVRRTDAASLKALVDTVSQTIGPGGDPVEAAKLQNLQAYLANNPPDLSLLIDDAQARISALYDQSLLRMQQPPAQRKPLVRDNADSPVATLFRALSTDPQRILDRYTNEQTQLHLLAVHLLIHRYRWEHNALPNALSELHADDLIKDPFTDNPLLYQKNDDRYTLQASAAPAR